MSIYYIAQLLLILVFPILAIWYQQKSRLSKWLSAIVLCYLVGILLRNFTHLPVNDGLAQQATELSILLAIPLLLFSTRFLEVSSYFRQGLGSFLLCILAGLISCIGATFLFRGQIPEAWKIGGMLVGIYTGGTPNMQAIGLATQAPQNYIILLNAADIFSGGLYLILLTSILPNILGRFMRPFDKHSIGAAQPGQTDSSKESYEISDKTLWYTWGGALLLSLSVLGLTLGMSYLFFGSLEAIAFIMLLLTSLAIACSFLPFVQRWQYTYELGEYFLLVFCVALGLQADFSTMLNEGQVILQFTAVAMFATILLHLLFSVWFRIDRDTFLIASTAALYGPAFIGQMATVINNRQLVLTGMALGLLGYAVGNYLGIGLAHLLFWWLS
jgi:uncharacterized membrane protein